MNQSRQGQAGAEEKQDDGWDDPLPTRLRITDHHFAYELLEGTIHGERVREERRVFIGRPWRAL